MLVGPLPGMVEELPAGEVVLFDTICSETVDHLCLGGDGSMIGARHPAGILALHACTPYQHILNGVVEHMTHVQYTRNVGWWDDDGVGFTLIGF